MAVMSYKILLLGGLMYAQVKGMTLWGLEGIVVTVEVDISAGLPIFDIVGLPNAAVKESKERVRAAIKNAGFDFPMRRIIVNLAPAHIRKDSAGLDLAIAIGILLASGQWHVHTSLLEEIMRKCVCIGELSLEGTIKPVFGALSMAMSAFSHSLTWLITNYDNGKEASYAYEGCITVGNTLNELLKKVENREDSTVDLVSHEVNYTEFNDIDISDVKGQYGAKKALEIAAAGAHHMVLTGPPGAGKTMLAKRMNTILPPLNKEEQIELTKIYSISGLLKNGELIQQRPFRSPHHTISKHAFCGGGTHPEPGEITLAHKGILFLDEAPEFVRSNLEILRQPLEDKEIHISRLQGKFVFPCDWILIMTMNPCPCGWHNTKSGHTCVCTQSEINRYKQKLSGPLLDRIDLFVPVERPNYIDMEVTELGESSMKIRERVLRAREIQKERYKGTLISTNSGLTHKMIYDYCVLTKDAKNVLEQAFHHYDLSIRAYDKLIKVGRTIADLEECEHIDTHHIATAISYNPQCTLGRHV